MSFAEVIRITTEKFFRIFQPIKQLWFVFFNYRAFTFYGYSFQKSSPKNRKATNRLPCLRKQKLTENFVTQPPTNRDEKWEVRNEIVPPLTSNHSPLNKNVLFLQPRKVLFLKFFDLGCSHFARRYYGNAPQRSCGIVFYSSCY